jgi:hypothetical protein
MATVGGIEDAKERVLWSEAPVRGADNLTPGPADVGRNPVGPKTVGTVYIPSRTRCGSPTGHSLGGRSRPAREAHR